MKTLLAILMALGITLSFAGVVDAHHGHNNLDRPGHQEKAEGRYAGELSPGHARHHED